LTNASLTIVTFDCSLHPRSRKSDPARAQCPWF
jgi:hypothetical protein